MIRHILLIDDDKDDAGIFEDALTEINSSVIFRYLDNGKKIFDTLNRMEPLPQIIFLDVNMPSVSGWDCLRLLKSNDAYRHIPVIMFSTSSHQKEADIASDLGAYKFMAKPHSYTDLKKMLANLLNSIEGC
ncbi:MAG: response regulator [Flavipsychrobacter sp.]|nr:response regulator [Flavipsychrobacter sp.]